MTDIYWFVMLYVTKDRYMTCMSDKCKDNTNLCYENVRYMSGSHDIWRVIQAQVTCDTHMSGIRHRYVCVCPDTYRTNMIRVARTMYGMGFLTYVSAFRTYRVRLRACTDKSRGLGHLFQKMVVHVHDMHDTCRVFLGDEKEETACARAKPRMYITCVTHVVFFWAT